MKAEITYSTFTREGNYKKSLRHKMGQVGGYDPYADLNDD